MSRPACTRRSRVHAAMGASESGVQLGLCGRFTQGRLERMVGAEQVAFVVAGLDLAKARVGRLVERPGGAAARRFAEVEVHARGPGRHGLLQTLEVAAD